MMNLFQLQEQLKDFSKQQLVDEMQSPSGNAPPFMVMTELQRRSRMENAAALDQGPPTTTVAQDAVNAAAVPQGGIADMARSMAPQTDMTQNTGAMTPQAGVAPQGAAPVQAMQEGGLAGISRDLRDYGVENDPAVRVMADRMGMSTAEYLASLDPEARSQQERRVARNRMLEMEPSGDGATFPTQEDLDQRYMEEVLGIDTMRSGLRAPSGEGSPSIGSFMDQLNYGGTYPERITGLKADGNMPRPGPYAMDKTVDGPMSGVLLDVGGSDVTVPQRLQMGQRGGGSSDYTPRPEYADPMALGLAGADIARMREVERAQEIGANRGPRVSSMATPEESLIASLTADPVQNVPIDVRDGSYIPPQTPALNEIMTRVRQDLVAPSRLGPVESSEFSKAKALEGKQTEAERRQLERQARTFGTDVESFTAGMLGETQISPQTPALNEIMTRVRQDLVASDKARPVPEAGGGDPTVYYDPYFQPDPGAVEGETTAEKLSRLGGPFRKGVGAVAKTADKALGTLSAFPLALDGLGSATLGVGASIFGNPELGQEAFDQAADWQSDAVRLANEGYFGTNAYQPQPENLGDMAPGELLPPVLTDTTPALTDTTPALTDTTPALTDTTPVVTQTAPGGGISVGGVSVPPAQSSEDRMLQQDKWLALARFGAALASSQAPTFGQALGQATTVGLDALGQAREDFLERKAIADQMALKRGALAARGGGGRGKAPSATMMKMFDDEIDYLTSARLMAETPEQEVRIKNRLDSLINTRDALRYTGLSSVNPALGVAYAQSLAEQAEQAGQNNNEPAIDVAGGASIFDQTIGKWFD